jgi:hypothetical protein
MNSHHNPRSPTIWLLAASTLLLPSIVTAAIYRCTSSDAPPHFSQFPCDDGQPIVLEPLHTVDIPPLSDAEQRLLDTLGQQRRADRERHARSRERTAREARARHNEQQQRCQAARADRKALARQRRKGYSISQARELERRDAELEAEERQNC